MPRPSRREATDPVAKKERHWARWQFALRHKDKLLDWAVSRGVDVTLSRCQKRWKFRRGWTEARWAPETAHLWFHDDVRQDEGKHGKAHEYEQVISVLEWVFP